MTTPLQHPSDAAAMQLLAAAAAARSQVPNPAPAAAFHLQPQQQFPYAAHMMHQPALFGAALAPSTAVPGYPLASPPAIDMTGGLGPTTAMYQPLGMTPYSPYAYPPSLMPYMTAGVAMPTALPGAYLPYAHLYHPHAAAAVPVAPGDAPGLPMAPYAYPWSYLQPPTTAGPYAGAAVQTTSTIETQRAPSADATTTTPSSTATGTCPHISPNKHTAGDSSSGHNNTNSSSTDSKSSTPVSASEHPGTAFEGQFDLSCSNRAINENRQLVVKFLTDETSERQFCELFEKFGPVENARIIYDRKTNHTKGFGFVTYKHAEHTVQALRTMGGYQLHGRQLHVALAQTERKRAFSAQELLPPLLQQPQDLMMGGSMTNASSASQTPPSTGASGLGSHHGRAPPPSSRLLESHRGAPRSGSSSGGGN